jgi:hypothetical protein
MCLQSQLSIHKGKRSLRGCASIGNARILRNKGHCKIKPPRRYSVQVEANELNKWGDTSGGDENVGMPEMHFEVECAKVVTRVLTAKAVQHILYQLGETNLIVCQWFNNYAAENSPLQGDDFVLKLMRQVLHRKLTCGCLVMSSRESQL